MSLVARFHAPAHGEFYGQSASMHRGARLLQQPPAAGYTAALADEPHGCPERRRRAGDHRQAVAILERLGDAERLQAAAGDQDALGPRRLRDRVAAERDDVAFALAARSGEFEDVEAFERPHLEAGRLQ